MKPDYVKVDFHFLILDSHNFDWINPNYKGKFVDFICLNCGAVLYEQDNRNDKNFPTCPRKWDIRKICGTSDHRTCNEIIMERILK